MTDVRMFEYLQQYAEIQEEVLESIERVLSSGQLILGPEVAAFESSFADFLGGRLRCVGVNSGTDAIFIGLKALGVGPGDEVITVSNTAVPTVSAIRQTGATPVFCDVDADSCLMDLDRLEASFSDRTKAVVPVHLFGNVVDVPEIYERIGSRPIRVLEDCAQAHGSELRGKKVGTLGDAAAFSFYPTKNLGAFGDGGLCCSPDPERAELMKSLRNYGFEGQYYSEREGCNSRLDELQAAILNVKLKRLPAYVHKRRALAAQYDRELAPQAVPVAIRDGVKSSYHLYVVRVSNREEVIDALRAHGIASGIHYPYPIHLMRGYAFLGYAEGSLPHTERLASEILSLPMYPELSPDTVSRICEVVGAAARE
ncbi:MAG: daunorubicin biosynthesis sensory transduction protein DnrJ [Gemmatimonas sp. SG8_38_2]|nr:MAG: daunorubicin biosynthesis sensory transduction protein DnrJ [Gemmatimonas sp. SG8_38_2]